jgi:D-tagatose-1,6-bisphosphate aldolase subunit GatZ/KbaZ
VRARDTLAIHREAFAEHGLSEAWSRVIALVVQPGVEFDNSAVVDYRPEKATSLKAFAGQGSGGIAFEAHSTDYQRPKAFAELVRDHFAVLKVGPALTFALREALFALSHIEDELVPQEMRSNLRAVCEERMLAEPKNWHRFYPGTPAEQALLRRYSLSDRIRYYWPDPAVDAACTRLLENLRGQRIPLGLLSQYLPAAASRPESAELSPASLVKKHVRAAISPYAAACSNRGVAV